VKTVTIVCDAGFDGYFAEYEHGLTPAEEVELADHMIAAWTEYRRKFAP
jgi:hypothetical protein